MPAKDVTKKPQHVIDEACKRYLAGESAAVLAKYYKISKPGFYLWVGKYKRRLLENSKHGDMTPKDAEVADKRTLIIEMQQLKAENRKLKDKVFTLMMKTGEI